MWQRSKGCMDVWQEKVNIGWNSCHEALPYHKDTQKYTLVPNLVFFSDRLCTALKKLKRMDEEL
jgi:hypothetical protein